MVTSRRHVWVKFLAIILLMTLLLRFSPSVTQTEPFAPLEWRLYVACNFLLLALYYPLAGRATEKITSRQLWLMLGGSILYALISWTTNIFRYPDISTITLRLGVVVPILMGLAFGPAVGFVVGSAGNHLGDFISGWGFFPLWNLGNGLMGLVAGLIHFVPNKYRAVPRLLTAELIILLLLLATQFLAEVQATWLVVYVWLIAVAAVAWHFHGRHPRPTTAIAWGTAGVMLGMGFASVVELWTLQLPLVEMLTKNLVVIIGANLLFVQTLLPLIYNAWE